MGRVDGKSNGAIVVLILGSGDRALITVAMPRHLKPQTMEQVTEWM